MLQCDNGFDSCQHQRFEAPAGCRSALRARGACTRLRVRGLHFNLRGGALAPHQDEEAGLGLACSRQNNESIVTVRAGSQEAVARGRGSGARQGGSAS